MESVEVQTNIATKLKRYTLLPLMAMGVAFGAFSPKAQAVSPMEAKQLDAETIRKLIYFKTEGKRLTDAEKKEAFNYFQEYADKAGFPKKIKKLVKLDTILDFEFYDGGRVLYVNDGMHISIQGSNSFPFINLYKIQYKDIAERLPPISNGKNTVTKKPYFSIPKNLAAKLSLEDRAYFKTLYRVLNSNFGTMMPMPHLDKKKVGKNEYAGKLVDRPVIFFGNDYPMLEKGMNETEIAVRRQLGFVLNGAVEMVQAGARLEPTAGNCTGWRPHSLVLGQKERYVPFVVYNGISNTGGAILYARATHINEQALFLLQLRSGLHKVMQEHGVEPGTNVKMPGLTPKQQIIARWGNVLDNYINMLFENKILGTDKFPYAEDQKTGNLDQLIGSENPVPPKEIKKINVNELKEVRVTPPHGI